MDLDLFSVRYESGMSIPSIVSRRTAANTSASSLISLMGASTSKFLGSSSKSRKKRKAKRMWLSAGWVLRKVLIVFDVRVLSYILLCHGKAPDGECLGRDLLDLIWER